MGVGVGVDDGVVVIIEIFEMFGLLLSFVVVIVVTAVMLLPSKVR